MSEVKSCGVLVVRGRPPEAFLLMVHPDRLDLPKGHIEPGETELECALRELEEETGIAPADIEIDERFRFTTEYPVWLKRQQRHAQKSTVIFLGYLKGDVPIQISEHTGYEWHAWPPPPAIQRETIDPLLDSVRQFFTTPRSGGRGTAP